MKTIEKQISEIKAKMNWLGSYMFYDVDGERHHVRQSDKDWWNEMKRVLNLYRENKISYVTVVEYNAAAQRRYVYYNKKGREVGIWMW